MPKSLRDIAAKHRAKQEERRTRAYVNTEKMLLKDQSGPIIRTVAFASEALVYEARGWELYTVVSGTAGVHDYHMQISRKVLEARYEGGE